MHTRGWLARRAPARTAARAAWTLAVAAGVSGCADGDIRRIPHEHATFTPASTGSRHQRESEMNRQWQNRPLSDLVATYGEPKMIMNIPGGGTPPSFAVVYGPDPASGCIDAFAVSSRGAPLIRIYHCR